MTMRHLLLALLLLLAPVAAEALQATVNWTDNSADETGFRVERAPDPAGPWASQGTVAVDVTVFNESGLALATQYCYRVVAFNTLGDAAPSSAACGTPNTPAGASGITVIFAP
jgi:hypothetical protein